MSKIIISQIFYSKDFFFQRTIVLIWPLWLPVGTLESSCASQGQHSPQEISQKSYCWLEQQLYHFVSFGWINCYRYLGKDQMELSMCLLILEGNYKGIVEFMCKKTRYPWWKKSKRIFSKFVFLQSSVATNCHVCESLGILRLKVQILEALIRVCWFMRSQKLFFSYFGLKNTKNF